MKELEFLDIIKKTLSKTSNIGDDCAYLKDLGIVITQDSLVEGIHFSQKFTTPFQLAYKAVMVNLSDIFASGAVPKYLTISLSMPKDIKNEFVSEFYSAVEELSKEYGFEVIGGDITGADKIFISICAIGLTQNRRISSRKNAKIGDYVVTTGEHGSSAAGLWLLQNGVDGYPDLVKSHLTPCVQNKFSNEIATKIDKDYAMMDTSDGLMDSLFKIAQASGVLISVDFDKIPYDKDIEEVATLANVDYKDWVFYGGEDFKIVACVDEENLNKLKNYHVIGQVEELSGDAFVKINFTGGQPCDPESSSGRCNTIEIKNLDKTFNHFKEG